MSTLRSVGGWGEVDLDQRAITTEDDIVDLSELERSDDQHNQPPPSTQNGGAGHDEPGEEQPSAAGSSPNRIPLEPPPASDAPEHESDEEFDRWVAHRAPRLRSGATAPTAGTPRPAPDVRKPTSGGAPRMADTASVSRAEPTVPAVTSPRSRLRRSGPLSLPLGRLARPTAAMAALTLAAGGTAIAINVATTSTPHARPQLSTSTASLTAGPRNPAGDALSATIAAASSELHALARAVPSARSTSHPPHKPRRHHPSHQVGISNHRHPAAVGAHGTTSLQTSPPPQTYNYTQAPVTSSSASQATSGSQTQATSRSQPFGQNGSLGPGRGAPGTQ